MNENKLIRRYDWLHFALKETTNGTTILSGVNGARHIAMRTHIRSNLLSQSYVFEFDHIQTAFLQVLETLFKCVVVIFDSFVYLFRKQPAKSYE